MTDPSGSAWIAAETETVPDCLVNPEWLSSVVDRTAIRLLDVRPTGAYLAGHIPGATQFELSLFSRQIDGVPGMLLPPDEYAAMVNRFGVRPDCPVVLYDSNWGMAAARVYWSLVRYGHTNVAVLNGGWDRWKEEGLPIDQDVVKTEPAKFTPSPSDSHIASYDWLRAHMNDPSVVIVDTRTPGEFAQGHLPGAVPWDWMNGVPMGSWDAVRPADELRSNLEASGIIADKEIVTYCRSGVRAAHTYLVLKYLKYPRVRNYDGSWLEWAYRANGNG